MRKIWKNIQKLRFKITSHIKTIGQNLFHRAEKRPLTSFFSLIGLLILLIVVGNFLRKPPQEKSAEAVEPKVVTFYSIGKAPKLELSASIDKSGALKMTAQMGGFVQNITKWEGETVKKGEQLIWLSTNAQGGNASSVGRQIAQQNYNFVANNFDVQNELIHKRREIAEKADVQSDELRDITDKSLGDTRNLISLNEQIVSSLDTQITQLESANVGGANDTALLQARQAKSGVLSGLSALRSALRNSEFQVSGDKAPAQISNLTRELTLKQLELEEKSLQLNREVSRLNLQIAQITEALMYPAAPCSGIIERIYIHKGVSVTPGTLLASLKCDSNWTSAMVTVPGEIARNVSRIEKSTTKIGDIVIQMTPRYISQEPTEGNLHTILFDIPEEYSAKLSNNSSLSIKIPVGAVQTVSSVPFVPLDAVYQTQSEAYLYVAKPAENNQFVVETRTINLGQVFGEYVEVTNGLGEADQVIVDRTVLEGDRVVTE